MRIDVVISSSASGGEPPTIVNVVAEPASAGCVARATSLSASVDGEVAFGWADHGGVPAATYHISSRNDMGSKWAPWSGRLDMIIMQGPSPRPIQWDRNNLLTMFQQIEAAVPGCYDSHLRPVSYINPGEQEPRPDSSATQFHGWVQKGIFHGPRKAWLAHDARGPDWYIDNGWNLWDLHINRCQNDMPLVDGETYGQWLGRSYAKILSNQPLIIDGEEFGGAGGPSFVGNYLSGFYHDNMRGRNSGFTNAHVNSTITEVLSTTQFRLATPPSPTIVDPAFQLFDPTGNTVTTDAREGTIAPDGTVTLASAPSYWPLSVGRRVLVFDLSDATGVYDADLDGVDEDVIEFGANFRQGSKQLIEDINTAIAPYTRHNPIRCGNGARWANAHIPDRLYGVPFDNEFVGWFDSGIYEWFSREFGFNPEKDPNGAYDGYYLDNEKDAINAMMLLTLHKRALRSDPAWGRSLTLSDWVPVEADSTYTVETWASVVSDDTKAHMRFAAGVASLFDHVAVGFTPAGSKSTVWIDECAIEFDDYWNPLNPPFDERWTQDPYKWYPPADPLDNYGAVIMPTELPPPDWGSHGYNRYFRGGATLTNLHHPGAKRHWTRGLFPQDGILPDPNDPAIFPQDGNFYKWVFPDCTTYVAPKRGFSMLGQDPAVNNGQDVPFINGAYTVQGIGQLESRFVLRVPVEVGSSVLITLQSAGATAGASQPSVDQTPVVVEVGSAGAVAGTATEIFVEQVAMIQSAGASAGASAPVAQAAGETIEVLSSNPVWFKYKGSAFYLSGTQNLRPQTDYAFGDVGKYVPSILLADGTLDQYIAAMKQRNWTAYRLWVYHSLGKPNTIPPVAYPLPWLRSTTPGAIDGGSKFDLSKFDGEYFDRVEQFVQKCYQNDIVVIIMLWDVYAFSADVFDPSSSYLNGTPWVGQNNINGVDISDPNDSIGWTKMFGYPSQTILDLQNAYVEHTIDVLNSYPNIIWELSNELASDGSPWHTNLRDHIRAYELTKPLQHIILGSEGGRGADFAWITRTPDETMAMGDCFAPGYGWRNTYVGGNMRNDPPLVTDYATKPAIADGDHFEAGEYPPVNTTPWDVACRGYHYVMYEPWGLYYEAEGGVTWQTYYNDAAHDLARKNMAAVAGYLNGRFSNLANAYPSETLCSTTFCLAEAGQDYLIYAPTSGSFTVNGLVNGATYEYEWFNISTGQLTSSGNQFVAAGTSRSLTPPYAPAGCYITRVS